MAHVGQEGAFGLVGGFGRHLGRGQVGLGLAQGFLGPFAIGDVGEHAEGAGKSARRGIFAADRDQDPDFLAVDAAQPAFVEPAARALRLAADHGLMQFVVFLVEEIANRPAGHVGRIGAEHGGHDRVAVGGVPARVHGPDPFVGGFHEPAVAGFAGGQGLVGPFAVGDVADHPDDVPAPGRVHVEGLAGHEGAVVVVGVKGRFLGDVLGAAGHDHGVFLDGDGAGPAREDLLGRARQDILLGLAGQGAKGVVDQPEPALGVLDVEGIGHGVDDPVEKGVVSMPGAGAAPQTRGEERAGHHTAHDTDDHDPGQIHAAPFRRHAGAPGNAYGRWPVTRQEARGLLRCRRIRHPASVPRTQLSPIMPKKAHEIKWTGTGLPG